MRKRRPGTYGGPDHGKLVIHPDPGPIFIPQGSVYADLHAERALADDLAAITKEAIHMVSVGSTLYGFDNREAWLAKATEVFARYEEARQ